MSTLPNHIAIIPDGNRRWAMQNSLLPWLGHKQGIAAFRKIIDETFRRGVPNLTFWALSIDNLTKRPAQEVNFLFRYVKEELGNPKTVREFVDNGTRVRVVGLWRALVQDKELVRSLEELEAATQKCRKFNLTILFVYDGVAEMLSAIKKLEDKSNLDYEKIKSLLWTSFLPEVDFTIRTGGEPHWSAGFMMWLARDSQFYFSPKLWPEFGVAELAAALDDFADRGRRLGG